MKRFNKDKYDSTIKSLVFAKSEIANSKHDRLSVDPDSDFEPSCEEVHGWLNSLNLPAPSDSRFSNVMELPEDYWIEIFGQSDDFYTRLPEYEEREIRNSKEYEELFCLYSEVYEALYEAVKEESAYYQREYEEEERYTLRGLI